MLHVSPQRHTCSALSPAASACTVWPGESADVNVRLRTVAGIVEQPPFDLARVDAALDLVAARQTVDL
jgi:hypothetical protein